MYSVQFCTFCKMYHYWSTAGEILFGTAMKGNNECATITSSSSMR